MDGEIPIPSTTQASPPIAVPTGMRSNYAARRLLMRAVMWSLPFLAVAVAVFFWMTSGRYVTTDNSYVKGDRVFLATEIAAPIVEVAVHENEHVSRGQLLYKLDDQPYRIQLARIESEIESQRAEIQGLKASWRTKREEIKSAESQEVYAQQDFDRQKDLVERKITAAAKFDESRMALDVAKRRVTAAQEDLTRIEAALAGDPKIKIDDHPKVKQLFAMREDALLNLRRTIISAPMDGIVQKVLVPGSYAIMGVPSIAVIADTDLWIEANFKETELTRVRVGQPVTITVDTYPDMKCSGKVTSLSQVTGAEFAVLPPQNANGNWVKVVQRIPLRTSVTCQEGGPGLRIGMSTTIEIDTGYRRSFADLLKGFGL
jgi:membrane fusion protein (multidrug efflux system)